MQEERSVAVLRRVVALLVALATLGPDRAGGEGSLPILAVDPLVSGVVMEHHADAVAHWAERGVSRGVLLHVDLHDDLRSVEAGKLASLKEMHGRGDLRALARAGRGGEGALFHEGNFVRVAAALGMVREVVWVVPFTFLEDEDAGVTLRAYLGRAGFPEGDVGTFRRLDGCFRGLSGGLPLTICPQERLPTIVEPVLLSLDVDYLPHAARYRGISLLTEIRDLVAALRTARYAVRDAVVSHSVHGGWVPVGLRWVGEAIVAALRDPTLTLGKEPPARWRSLQRLTTLRGKGRQAQEEVLELSHALLGQDPHDPAVLLFAAEAMAGHGGAEAALVNARQACQVDRGYCAGLREIGLQLLARGDVDGARRFFAEGDRLLPGMVYGEIDEGVLFVKAGRPVEALAAFDRAFGHDRGFSAAFLAGAVHLALGDRAAARRAFDQGGAALAQSPEAGVDRAEVAEAIRGAVEFYRREGLPAAAERLEHDPRLRPPPPGVPPPAADAGAGGP